MSVSALKHIRQLRHNHTFTITEWAVLNELAWHYSDQQGCAWPSAATLAKETGACRRVVFKVLGALTARGVLVPNGHQGQVVKYAIHGLGTSASDAPDLCTTFTSAPRALVHNSTQTSAPDAPPSAPRAHHVKNMKEKKEKNKTIPNEVDLFNTITPKTTCLAKPDDAAQGVAEIFGYWQQVMNHPKAKLTGERKTKVQARLREGYTLDDIKQAIDGCKVSEFHQGANDDSKIYDDLTLIARSGSNIERFMGYATRKALIDNGQIRQHTNKSRNELALESAARWLSTPDPIANTGVSDTAIAIVPWSARVH